MRLSAVSPDLACDAGAAVPVTVVGVGFAPVATGALAEPSLSVPTVTLTRAGGLTGPDDGGDASLLLSPADATLRWVDAETLAFDASPAIGLVPGAWDVIVTNPDGQSDRLDAGFGWTAAPALVDIAPSNVCIEAGAAPLTITGTGFLFYDGVGPSVSVAGGDPLPAEPGDCEPLVGERDGSVCTSVTVTVDATALPLGEVAVTLTNPAPADCAAAAPASFTVTLPPSILTVEPGITCSDGGVLHVTGERLPEDPIVTVGGVPAASVTFVDADTLEIVVAEGTPDGSVEVVVAGVDGCEATATVEIVGEPDVFFVDPPTVYDGLSIEVTAWLADVSSEVTDVWLTDEGGTRTSLAFEWDEDDPDRVVATVPAGLAAGSYGFGFVEADGCGSELPDALTVTDELTVAVEALDPAFAWAWSHTPVQVIATDPAPAGEVGFVATPRVYVTEVGGGSASAVEGVSFRDAGLLTATIPPGLAPGVYDVLVVNPDHTVGLLPSGLTVTEEQPPSIISVSPPGLENSVDETVRITGTSFRDPSVSLTCREDGVERTVAAEVVSSTYTSIDAVVPSTDFLEAICTVTVTNDDGTSVRWAALSIRNPAENLFPWSAGSELVEARRAPVAAAGRTTSVSRWVYAVGGDPGDAGGALTSVERAPMGVYGELGSWELLPGALPSPVTLAAGVTIGDFVYVVGGNDGTGPVANGWRAHILDPMDVPRFESLSIDDEGSIGPGEWTWRIASLYDAADETNPGGESLPGDPITVALPDVGGLSVEIAWTPVEGAVGYRVYRSPTADSADVEWVADTPVASFLDDGVATDARRSPLPEGALGEWAALPALIDAREAPCVAFAPDPIPDPVIVHLYAAGGLAPDGEPLDSVEVLDIQVVNDGEHIVGDWDDAGVELEEERWACGAWTVESSLHSVVEAGETWVYFGGGEGESRTVGDVDAGRVGEGGRLEEWQQVDSMSPARSGFGAASASDFLYAFGGQGGEASTGGVSGELGYEPVPEVRNWNSLGESLTRPRFLPGSAQESAVIVLVGGATDTETATRSTDVTNW